MTAGSPSHGHGSPDALEAQAAPGAAEAADPQMAEARVPHISECLVAR